MDAEYGFALAALTEQELARMRRQRRQQIQPQPEVPTGSVIERLTNAAMPSVVRNSRHLQKVRAENELQRQRNERAAAFAKG